MTSFYNISQDNTLGGNNASHNTASSQRAIKEYVDNKTNEIPTKTSDLTNDSHFASVTYRKWTNQ